jgi:hypothetical protein
LRRQRQFDPAGAAADHGEPQPGPSSGLRQQRFPARREARDRLDRDRMLGRPRHLIGARGGADVE